MSLGSVAKRRTRLEHFKVAMGKVMVSLYQANDGDQHLLTQSFCRKDTIPWSIVGRVRFRLCSRRHIMDFVQRNPTRASL